MERRQFLKKGALGTGLAATALATPSVHAKPQFKWKMVTTWPTNFPGLGTGANYLAKLINTMSHGRIQVKVFGAGELVPAFEVFDTVSSGTAEMGHGAAYYWKGKAEATQFFAAVPFGLNAQEMNGWLYHGGGLKLWQELYSDFNLVPFPAGNTGVQMAGWFNQEIRSMEDLKGLKMRIPGLGGEVLKQVGVVPVNIPGGELYVAMQKGVIDAAEWVGPYNDHKFGFHKIAKYYYYPGWHEPGSTLEAIVNQKVFAELPSDLQAIVEQACAAVNTDMLADFTVKNHLALDVLIKEFDVQLKPLPEAILTKLRATSKEVVNTIAEKDPVSKKVYASYEQFKNSAQPWQHISEQAYLNARNVGQLA